MKFPCRSLLVAVTISTPLLESVAQSDVTGQAASVAAIRPARTLVSLQPLNAVRQLYQVEFERALSNTVALGLAGSHLHDDDGNDKLTYSTADLKLRYYPSARPFEGFSFAVSAGYGRLVERWEYNDGFNPPETDEDEYSGPTVGTFLDYGWLLGPTRRFYVGAGIGAKALLVDYDTGIGSFNLRYPTARVSVGMGF